MSGRAKSRTSRRRGQQHVASERDARPQGHGAGGDDARRDRPRPALRQLEAETKKALGGEGDERADDERDEEHEADGGEERVFSAGPVLPDTRWAARAPREAWVSEDLFIVTAGKTPKKPACADAVERLCRRLREGPQPLLPSETTQLLSHAAKAMSISIGAMILQVVFVVTS